MARKMAEASFEELLQRRDFILQIDNEFNREQNFLNTMIIY